MFFLASESDSSSSSSPISGASATSYKSWRPSRNRSTRHGLVHPASLVDPSTHSRELMQLVDIKLSTPVIEYVVDCVSESVEHAFRRSSNPSLSLSRCTSYKKFAAFISTVLSRAEIAPTTVLVALVYITRTRPHLSIALQKWALERVLLGALIVASKFTNDSALNNTQWALCTGVFGKRDIGRVEREFLDVLDWELRVSEADLMAHHEALVAPAAVLESEFRCLHNAKAQSPDFFANNRLRRFSTGVSVAQLALSSPHTSMGSMFTQTPSAHQSIRPVVLDSPAKQKKTHGKLYNLLHSFPPPRHHHHRHTVEVAP